jgi:hypothetical protein
MGKAIREQLAFIRSPSKVLRELASDPKAALFGFKHVLIIAVLYDLAIVLWAFGANALTLPPFLKIPEENYYFYAVAFYIPLFFVMWLLASAVAYVMSKAMGGKGSFDAILGGFGLTIAVSAYFTLIPDYIQGILWNTGLVPFDEYIEITSRGILLVIVWTYMLMYLFAHIVLYALTIRVTQGISASKSALVAVVSFVVSFAVWITYAR